MEYMILFAGVFIFGETVIMPGMYLAFRGHISLWGLIMISFLATVLSDVSWFIVGRALGISLLARLPIIGKHREKLKVIVEKIKKRGVVLVVLSKFIYGSRILTQISCGISGLSFGKYLAAIIAATLAWLGVIFSGGYLAYQSLRTAPLPVSPETAAVIIIIILLLIYKWIIIIMKKRKYP